MFKTLGLIACLTISAITTRGADIIIIPVTFKDLTNSIGTQVEIGTVMTNFWKAYYRGSYRQSLDITLADPVALSGNADDYPTKYDISDEAQDQTPNHVNFDTVITMNKFKFNDSAEVGGRLMWLQTLRVETMLHEYGHILGLGHANLWCAYGDCMIGPGSTRAYGNGFDWMGPDTPGGWLTKDYSVRDKLKLGWIPQSSIIQGTANGTYRIHAYDVYDLNPTNKYGLSVNIDTNYLITYKGIQDVVTVTKEGAFGINDLIDMNPNTHWDNDYIDAGLEPGRTLAYYSSTGHVNDMFVTCLEIGDGWVDLNVNIRSTLPFLAQPTLDFVTDVLTDTNDTYTGTITAVEPEWTDFNWNTGDGIRHPNTNVLVHQWATPGKKKVWCWISSRSSIMAIVTADVLIHPTNSNFVSAKGYITGGYGARVSVGSGRFAYCSPNGFFQVNGLQTGHTYQLNYGQIGGATFFPVQKNFVAGPGLGNYQFITASPSGTPNNPPIIVNTTPQLGYHHAGDDLNFSFKVYDEDPIFPLFIHTTNLNWFAIGDPDPANTVNFKFSATWTDLPAGTNEVRAYATDSFSVQGNMIPDIVSVWGQVVIDGISQSTNGTLLDIIANPGQVLQAQGSSNLIDWVGLAYLTNGTGTNTTWLDASTENERFYRMLHVD